MRILYAAGNRSGSYEQLKRYLPLFKNSGHEFRIAGYKKSIRDLTADYCLDALLNFIRPEGPIEFNGNFTYYSREISKFRPDLIISDLELYTSVFAIDQGFPIWQVSPTVLYYGLKDMTRVWIAPKRYNKGITGTESADLLIRQLLQKSTRRIALSHLCDFLGRPKLRYGYEWGRPEFRIKQDNTTVAKTDGTSLQLADAFYNEQYALMKLSEGDIETVPGIAYNTHYGLGQLENHKLEEKKITVSIDDEVKFLMEMIK